MKIMGQSGARNNYCQQCMTHALNLIGRAHAPNNEYITTALNRIFPDNSDIQFCFDKFCNSLMQSNNPEEESNISNSQTPVMKHCIKDIDKTKKLDEIVLTCGDCGEEVQYQDRISHSLPHIVRCSCGDFTPVRRQPYKERFKVFLEHRKAGKQCQYCKKKILCATVQDHEEICSKRDIKCPVKDCSIRATNENMLAHIARYSSIKGHTLFHCPYCPDHSQPVRALMYPRHFNTVHARINQDNKCPYCDDGMKWEMTDRELLEHVSTTHTEKYVELSCLDPNTPVEENQKVLFELMTKADELFPRGHQAEQTYSDSSIKDLTTHLSILDLNLQAVMTTTHNGRFLWRIPDVKKRIQSAKDKIITSIYSPPFYTGQNGYKMCIRAYLNGDGDEHTHLSVFFVLMKGEYDPLLEFPFKHKFSLVLVDQNENPQDRQHIIHTLQPDLLDPSFQRPEECMNRGSGVPEFCGLEMLNDPRYVKDDVMYIKCIVDTSEIIHP